MSLYDYQVSLMIGIEQAPFAAVIMAAMRQADSCNLEALKAVFPEIWDEFIARYRAPGGMLPGEHDHPNRTKTMTAIDEGLKRHARETNNHVRAKSK
ncbi:MAG TPA: hypothetical protein VE821_15910 [Pyrinomonadaceae bacterium]|nr:hypothetical protein [Pyrinomonadaceae bacterium]